MINNNNDSHNDQKPEEEKPVDDQSGIFVTGFIKITDPDSGEVILEQKD